MLAECLTISAPTKTDLEGANSFEQISVGHNASSLFRYTPPRKYAGTTQAACFAARGAPGPLRVQEEAVTCLDIEIERCVWTIKEGESLLSMAQDLGMSWLQLWNYNKMTIRKPDQDLLAVSPRTYTLYPAPYVLYPTPRLNAGGKS